MNKRVLIFLLILSCSSFAQNKKSYDVNELKLSKTSAVDISEIKSSNSKIEASLITGGYFTLGIDKGNPLTTLDDGCQVTYGHPYAMTSFPVFSVDGKWIKANELTGTISGRGDTLSFIGSAANIDAAFVMILEDQRVRILVRVKNTGIEQHTFGSGIVLDPALGKWGDGVLYSGMKRIVNDTLMNFTNGFDITLREKSTGAGGIGVQVTSASVNKMIVNNWNESLSSPAPEVIPVELKILYDMVLRIYFNDTNLAAGEEKSEEISVTMLEPDFNSKVFTRWDLPGYFDLADNLMFPRNFDTYTEILNTSSAQISCEQNIIISDLISSLRQNYQLTIPASTPLFNKVTMKSQLTFENRIVTASVVLKENNVIIDELRRNIFLPATPVSDTGLVITDDSLGTTSFPEVNLFFAVENSSTGNRILDLAKENIYLYENGSRIDSYALSKFASGGPALADVVFVLDISGSMGDNINQVRSYIGEFADSLAKRGYDYKMGIVTFSTTVDSVWDLTEDIEFLKRKLGAINLWGGVEDSPSALFTASNLSFRPGSKRTIIWVTDEEYPETKYTKLQVVDQMLRNEITVHGVGPDFLQTEWFNPILIPTGGKFYNIIGNFRDILMDVSRMEAQDKYHISYQSKLQTGEQKELTMKVFYGGYGAVKTYTFNGSSNPAGTQSYLSYYPNPFNPEITFKVKPGNYSKVEMRIFSILGECVKTYKPDNAAYVQFTWNAKNDMGSPVSTGFYIVQLIMTDINDKVYQESAKILFLK